MSSRKRSHSSTTSATPKRVKANETPDPTSLLCSIQDELQQEMSATLFTVGGKINLAEPNSPSETESETEVEERRGPVTIRWDSGPRTLVGFCFGKRGRAHVKRVMFFLAYLYL